MDKIFDILKSIDKRLSKVETSVSGINDYIKKQVTLTEDLTVNKLVEYLNKYCTACFTKRIHLKTFYSTKGKEVTDFDGCIYFALNPKLPPSRAKNISLRNNSNFLSDYLIIIENKTTLDKCKFDTKMKQMQMIYNEIIYAKGANVRTFHTKFIDMISSFDIINLANEIILVFACDSMTQLMRNFIIKVDNGLNEEEYKIMTFDLISEDRSYLEFMKKFKHLIRKCKNRKLVKDTIDLYDNVSDWTTLQTFLNSIKNLGNIAELEPISKHTKYLCSFCIPFCDVQTYYSFFNKKLGLIHGNVIVIPSIPSVSLP
jgi:hypothetical protein